MATTTIQPEHLHALVDMGSNGIRFSITNLAPPMERIMPTLYQNRVGISLYDAQYSQSGERIPIDDKTIATVLSAFQRFKRTCQDFKVPPKQISVLATEATRTALNSDVFRQRISERVDWEVQMLAKEEEGRVGALGVASSLPKVRGLVMDLGGGSTQLSWLIKDRDSGHVCMPDTVAVSMPYGAAAMTRRLTEAEKSSTTDQLRQEIIDNVKRAYTSLKIPTELEQHARSQGGFTLYLSGGGFRGWGYVIMSQHSVQPYPIPVINGFRASRDAFLGTDQIKTAAAAALDDPSEEDIFRVSDRRASQVPAVAFLVNALATALPQIHEVRFCQGGVREGFLFSSLPDHIRALDPLVVATTQPSHDPDFTHHLADLLASSLPHASSVDSILTGFSYPILQSFASLLNYHASHSKDLRASAALRSTTSGLLASTHGIHHESRALLALLLCARWSASLPPVDELFRHALESLLPSPAMRWWIKYLGTVAALLADIYPAPNFSAGEGKEADRLRLKAHWTEDKKHGKVLSLRLSPNSATDREICYEHVHELEKVGKRKRWVEGVGYHVAVTVTPGDVDSK